uniref:efflux RND transporter periplasmic adaptor subunit n=1 Tax=Gelidibacter sp. TaxID=2018083 RepID=UPI00404A72D8
MKHIYSLLVLSIIITSCGGDKKKSVEDIITNGNLTEIREKRNEVDAQKLALEEQIKLLDEKIAELDTVKRLPLVTTFKVEEQVFNHYLELQGNVETNQNIVIYPEMGGVLQRVYVTEGQKVTKGQLLATIDDGGLAQQVAQLQIQADLAKTTFERQERLWNQKIGSEIQYLQAKSSYEGQQKAVNQLKSQLGKTAVKAPFSGVIDDVITDQGSVVSPGVSQLMRIVNLDDMYIKTDVPETYISNITKNKEVQVEFPVLGKSITSKVRQAGNYINPANRTFKVEIAVPNADKDIKPNLTAKLKINDYTNEKAILIPLSIISEDADGQQYIYIVDEVNADNEATAKRVIIETGKPQGDEIEVLKGLTNNAQIIQEGARTVKDGQVVKIITY